MHPARELIDRGMAPEGAYNNLKFLDGKVDFAGSIKEEAKLLLTDPQTSGGLLITLNKDAVKFFSDSQVFFSVIGRVAKGSGRILVT
jgi:selenide,water dikinase